VRPGAIAAAVVAVGEVVAPGDAEVPGVAGALTAGRFACGGCTGGFGPKNFAQSKITPMDNNEATRIRSSGVNLSFCPGTLTSAPHSPHLTNGRR